MMLVFASRLFADSFSLSSSETVQSFPPIKSAIADGMQFQTLLVISSGLNPLMYVLSVLIEIPVHSVLL